MRRILTLSGLVFTLLTVAPRDSWAQQPSSKTSGIRLVSGEHCAEPARPAPPCRCPRCSPPSDCTEPPTRPRGEMPPEVTDRGLPPGTPTAEMLGPRGTYVAPPRSGVAVGESRSWGLNGLAITLPSVRLAMPSIELPSLYRASRAPHMRVDAATAPYVEQQATGPGFMAGIPAIPMGVGMMPQMSAAQVEVPQAGPRSLPVNDRNLDRGLPIEEPAKEPADAPRKRNLPLQDCTKGQLSHANSPSTDDLKEELIARIQRLDQTERELQAKMTRLQRYIDQLDAGTQPPPSRSGSHDAGPQPVYQDGRRAVPGAEPVTGTQEQKRLVQPSAYQAPTAAVDSRPSAGQPATARLPQPKRLAGIERLPPVTNE